jgi:DNA polymerase-3 subunit delta'
MIAPWLRTTWAELWARRQADRMPHALLLAGPQGLGKRTFASALMQALLCEQPGTEGFACGHCRACRLLAAQTHADGIRITFGLRDNGKLRTEIIVEQIRALCESITRTAGRGGWRVVLIDPADALNRNAANALLKTLEEPEAKVLIVLLADQPGRLPATIISRCQRIVITLPSRDLALNWLKQQGIDDRVASESLALADGNPGEALGLAAPAARERLDEVVTDIEAIAAGHETYAIASRWADEHADGRLRTLARLLTAALRPVQPDTAPAILRLHQVLAQADFVRLNAAWEQSNFARSQLDASLRKDLQILEVLQRLRGSLRR